MGDSLANLIVHVGADLSDFNKEMDKFQRNVNKISGQLSQAGSSLTQAVTVPLLAIGGAATKMAMDAVESENLFETSLGNMAQSARAWSEETSEALGLNAYELRRNTGLLYAMFQSMKLGQKDALGMSEGLTQLAYDMASFYNLKPEEAFEKLRAGIAGETEPLKALGILVDETTTKTYAYTHGIAAQGTELTQQQKVLARYGAIMEQTKTAQGDLARTITSPTNQLRVLGEQVKQVSVDLGMSLIPMFQEALTAARPLIDRVKEWVREFTNMDEGTKRVVVQVGLLAAALGPAILAIGKAMQVAGSLITVVRTLTGALVTLCANPIVLAIAGVAALSYGIYRLVTAGERAEEEAYQQSESLLALAGRYEEAKTATDGAREGTDEYKAASEKTSQAIRDIGEQFPELVRRWDEHGNAVELDTQRLRDNTVAARENVAAHSAKELAEKQRTANQAYTEWQAQAAELEREKGLLEERMRRLVETGQVSQSDAEQILAAEIATLTRQLDGDIQAARQAYERAIADVVKMTMQLYGGTDVGTHDMIGGSDAPKPPAPQKQAPKPGGGTTNPYEHTPDASQYSAAAMGQDTQKKIDYLGEFESAWERTQDAATTALERAQQDQMTAFRDAQAESLAEKRSALDREQTAYADSLDDQHTAFKNSQADQKTEFEKGLRERREKRRAELDKELSDLREAHQKELQAIQDRYDGEQAIRNGELRDKLKAKQDEIDRIRQAEEDEANAKQRADLVARIAKSEEELQKARWTKIPAKIAEAEARLAADRQAVADLDLKLQRKTQVDRLQAEMDAIREEYRLKDEQAAKDQKAETAKVQARQKADLEAKQARLAQLMQDFEDELAQEQTNFERGQSQDLVNKQRELDGLKKANREKLDERLRAFQAQQAHAETNFKRAQEDQAAQYRDELAALHSHLQGKLAEQQAYVNNVAALQAQVNALLRSMPTPSLPGGGGLDALSAAKNLAGQGRLEEAAQMLSGAWKIPIEQARENLKNVPKLAAGGIVTRPTLALIGEAGPEPVMPLGTLWTNVQRMAMQVARTVAGDGAGDIVVPVEFTVDGEVLARTTIRHSKKVLRQAGRALGPAMR